jgi:hypothetical protein
MIQWWEYQILWIWEWFITFLDWVQVFWTTYVSSLSSDFFPIFLPLFSSSLSNPLCICAQTISPFLCAILWFYDIFANAVQNEEWPFFPAEHSMSDRTKLPEPINWLELLFHLWALWFPGSLNHSRASKSCFSLLSTKIASWNHVLCWKGYKLGNSAMLES